MCVVYSDPIAPSTYVCNDCKADNCKLWREYQTFDPELLCARCCGRRTKESIETLDEAGMIVYSRAFSGLMRTDQIGGWVPAVPDEEGETYWGYTSVPQAGVEWWQRLPSLPL